MPRFCLPTSVYPRNHTRTKTCIVDLLNHHPPSTSSFPPRFMLPRCVVSIGGTATHIADCAQMQPLHTLRLQCVQSQNALTMAAVLVAESVAMILCTLIITCNVKNSLLESPNELLGCDRLLNPHLTCRNHRYCIHVLKSVPVAVRTI